jgi:FkbM family methyltransferase
MVNLFKYLSKPYPVESIDKFSKIIIYGAGNTGKEVLRVLRGLSGVEVISFMDLRASKDFSIDGIPVFHPEEVTISDSLRKECLVIMAIFNRDVDLLPTANLLKGIGFKNVISFVQFHHFYPRELGNKYWLGPIDVYKKFEDQIKEVNSLLEDDESKMIFESILKYRFTGSSELLTQPEGLDTQYFSKSIPSSEKKLRFIDGGAYNGDTLLAMMNLGKRCEAVTSFEPDLLNFNELVDFSLQNKGKIADEINLLPCAVWSKTEYLKFNSNSTEASSVSAEGLNTILGVSIDETIPDFRPTFIKMDIEGAEIEGLLGAVQTIKEFRPGLGICIYHTPEHLWEIPLLIKSWGLNYSFHVRAHGNNGFDLVLYAIPH